MPTSKLTFDFTPGPLYVGADNLLEITNLTDQTSGSLVSTATIASAIEDEHGNNVLVSLPTWSLVSAGRFRCEIEDGTITLSPGRRYVIRLTITISSDVTHVQEFEVWSTGGASERNHNWFGATVADLVALFPGAKESDFGAGAAQGDQGAIERELDAATERVLNACPARLHAMLHEVIAELIEDDADSGQTVAYLGLPSAQTTGIRVYKNYIGCPIKPGRSDALASTAYTATQTAQPPSGSEPNVGKVKITLTAALTEGETVHASYALNTAADSYVFRSLADAVLKSAAGVLGGALYTMQDSVWSVVAAYAKEAESALKEIASGALVPSELRLLKLCEELDRVDDEIGTVPWYRA